MTEHRSAKDVGSNNVNKKLVVHRFDELLCSACSTGKRPTAGRANFQHQGLTEKGNK